MVKERHVYDQRDVTASSDKTHEELDFSVNYTTDKGMTFNLENLEEDWDHTTIDCSTYYSTLFLTKEAAESFKESEVKRIVAELQA